MKMQYVYLIIIIIVYTFILLDVYDPTRALAPEQWMLIENAIKQFLIGKSKHTHIYIYKYRII